MGAVRSTGRCRALGSARAGVAGYEPVNSAATWTGFA